MRRGDRQLFEDGHPQHLLAERVCRQTEIAYHSHQIPGDETMTKNTGKSIRTRLLNLSRKEGVDYMKVFSQVKDLHMVVL